MRPDLLPDLGALGGIHTALAWADETGYDYRAPTDAALEKLGDLASKP